MIRRSISARIQIVLILLSLLLSRTVPGRSFYPSIPNHPIALNDLTRFVDPFIGTGGHGHTFPGATLPFGMVQLSPDTRLTGWDSCSGYHDSDRGIYGFSHTHLSGTGALDYGDILMMPITGAPRTSSGAGGD